MSSGRMSRHGWSESRKIPDFGSGRRAAARRSRASSEPTEMRSSCGLAVDALALRAVMAIPGFPRGVRRENRLGCRDKCIERLPLVASLDNRAGRHAVNT